MEDFRLCICDASGILNSDMRMQCTTMHSHYTNLVEAGMHKLNAKQTIHK